MVAGRAAFLRFDVEFLDQLETEFAGGGDGVVLDVFGNIGIAVVEIEDLLKRAEVLFGGAVAFEAPAHRVALGLINDFHFMHVAVAALAGNPAIHVGGVVEIHVVG